MTSTSLQAASLPNACSLLTKREVENALSAKIANRTERSFHDLQSSCIWTSVSVGGFADVTAQVSVQITRRDELTLKRFADLNDSFAVCGLGRLAYASVGNGGHLDVWQHGLALTVSTTSVTSPLVTQKSLAKEVLGRL